MFLISIQLLSVKQSKKQYQYSFIFYTRIMHRCLLYYKSTMNRDVLMGLHPSNNDMNLHKKEK